MLQYLRKTYLHVSIKVTIKIPANNEFLLEYWLNSNDTKSKQSNNFTTHYPHLPLRTKRRRHQKYEKLKENQWIDLAPIFSSDINEGSKFQLFPCSKDSFGGYGGLLDSEVSDDNETFHSLRFNLLLKTYPNNRTHTGSSFIVFRLKYKSLLPNSTTYEQTFNIKISTVSGSHFHSLIKKSMVLNLSDLWKVPVDNIGLPNCEIELIPQRGYGLQVIIKSLNIYGIRELCGKRYLSFDKIGERNELDSGSSESLFDFSQSRLPFGLKYCGKTEDYTPEEKLLVFSSTVLNKLHGKVVLKISLPNFIQSRESFSLEIKPLSPCQNVLLRELNGSLNYQRQESDETVNCSILIHVPYGNTILVQLKFRENTTRSESSVSDDDEIVLDSLKCNTTQDFVYLQTIKFTDYLNRKSKETIFCIYDEFFFSSISQKSLGNKLKLEFELRENSTLSGFNLIYSSISLPEIINNCDYGWVHVQGLGCVLLVEKLRSWNDAELDCRNFHDAHLVTVKNVFIQKKIQHLIIESALFHPSQGYWIGANDRESEGNFQWTSGLPFIFANWFSGWSNNNNENEIVGPRRIDVDFESSSNNRQPNDDGFSGQDCVEIRQRFTPPTSNSKLQRHYKSRDTSNFYWNDRNCNVQNFYICEKSIQQAPEFMCNRTIKLNSEGNTQQIITITSPAYPSSYPDNIFCATTLEAGRGYKIILSFDEFVLEESPGCKYDYLEVIENSQQGQESEGLKYCGDWTKKLKLLRYISNEPKVTLKFESDFSHHFSGYKAKVWTEKDATEECEDYHMQGYGSHCYLFVTFPALNWNTAQQVCSSLKGNLASVVSMEEWKYLTQFLVSSPDYDKKTTYWLGGHIDQNNQLLWKDGLPFNFSAFHPSDLKSISEWKCLTLYWHEGGKGTFAWRLSDCAHHSGYICKKLAQVDSRTVLNRTFTGIGGNFNSDNFPNHYHDNLDYTNQLIAPPGTRIVLQFQYMDIEFQDDCLYDYVEIIDRKTKNFTRFCGTGYNKEELKRFNFVSSSNVVDVNFHSDFSNTYTGYGIRWLAVDVTECLSDKILIAGPENPGSESSDQEKSAYHKTATSTFHTPNFPNFNLPNLNCSYTIVAPAGHRVWLHFEVFEIGIAESSDTNCGNGDYVLIELENNEPNEHQNDQRLPMETQHRLILCGNLTNSPYLTSFVSYNERISIKFISVQGKSGRGFVGKYYSVPDQVVVENILIPVQPNSSFYMTSLNYPLDPPPNVNISFGFFSPPNYMLTIRIRGNAYPNCFLTANSYIIITDPYVGSNGTSWIICDPDSVYNEEPIFPASNEGRNKPNAVSLIQYSSPITFHSTFNRLQLTQVYHTETNSQWNVEVVTTLDENFRSKVLAAGDRLLILNACNPNPCTNGGKCVTDGDKHICRCQLPYTGPFCGLSICDLNPCLFGECIIEGTSFRCACHLGYGGERCNRRSLPCDDKPCGTHGECHEINGTSYQCLCHAFWEGLRCEARMQHIPFRPLSERMLKEPFWLGIITVTVVLGVIGLVWCLKRHFPEKLEKFLNEDLERNRGISWVSGRTSSMRLGGGCSYHGIREPIPGTSSQVQATSPQASRSFLGKFGIRKPSLLSLSSTTSVSAANTSPHNYESRTFSLDDLLRPSRSSMMRTPSPHRRRNFSIHARRDPMEKQQILQQLISSGGSQSLDGESVAHKPSTPKPTIAEIIQMSEKRLRLASASSVVQQTIETSPTPSISNERNENETSFCINPQASTSGTGGSGGALLTPTSKAEKKVTFARLLDKLTNADMSSSSSLSDLSCAEDGIKTIVQINYTKPAKKDGRKGRFRRSKSYHRGRTSQDSTDQDCIEISSSDTTPDPIYPPRFPTRLCISPTSGLAVSSTSTTQSTKPTKSLTKIASADSLLALFRRFSGSSSAPPSPQYSENEESSAGKYACQATGTSPPSPGQYKGCFDSVSGATPLSTPSSPRNSTLTLNIRPPAFCITSAEQNANNETTTTDPYGSNSTLGTSWRSNQNPNTITLDVPMRDYCLSPIHEVPTPLPTPSHSPAHTPMMQQRRPDPVPQTIPDIHVQASSDAENENSRGTPTRKAKPIPRISISVDDEEMTTLVDAGNESDLADVFEDNTDSGGAKHDNVIPDVLIHVPQEIPEDTYGNRFTFDTNTIMKIDPTYSPVNSPGTANTVQSASTSPRIKTKPPPLVFANEILSSPSNSPAPAYVTAPSQTALIPSLNVQNATPVQDDKHPEQLFEKVPSTNPDITAFTAVITTNYQPHFPIHTPLIPPVILINQSSEAESDSDSTVHKITYSSNKANLGIFLTGPADRVLSESNLSTSGYSSMASPCPSRCPSTSPLCPETDDYHPSVLGFLHSRRSSLITPCSSRKSSLTMQRRCSLNATSPLQLSFPVSKLIFSETLEKQEEYLDSAIEIEETDMECSNEGSSSKSNASTTADPDEKSEICEEINTINNLLQVPRKSMTKSRSFDSESTQSSGASSKKGSPIKGESLDSKLNSYKGGVACSLSAFTSPTKFGVASNSKSDIEKKLSPVSSRSESPISELSVSVGNGGGFTTPITDSDGLYDCASSATSNLEVMSTKSINLSPSQQIKRSGKRRDRRMSASGIGLRTNWIVSKLTAAATGEGLELLSTTGQKARKSTASSPKRRVRAQPNLDASSSSTESLNSQRSKGSSISSLLGREESLFQSKSKRNQRSPVASAEEELLTGKTLPTYNKESKTIAKKLCSPSSVPSMPQSRESPTCPKKIIRLRTIGLQIRFLRRLEKSLIKKRENIAIKGSKHEHKQTVTTHNQGGSSEESTRSSSNSDTSSSRSCSSCSCCSSCDSYASSYENQQKVLGHKSTKKYESHKRTSRETSSSHHKRTSRRK